ncbi:MAG: tRNA (adenosine(37)-N6)-threonylcarbamoyltransferase complex transferase subunit TsaD [Candidatus Aenigmarchaeota archaeon]|nr:tRNA (adenosine(37)-N6)-threonylcarbamoyltransferase complex transferase subunit TsaD [Candidatus Aenigmarchaeota archaeon]
MKFLSVDTSCDETSASVCKDDRVLSNIISSQVDLHNEWGGVVPSIAKRIHQERIDPTISLALKRARLKIEDIDAFAITIGPGLAIALEVGIKKIKELSQIHNKPIIVVNHMEGHIYSNFAKNSEGSSYNKFKKPKFPVLCLLVSGNHTELVLMSNHGNYKLLGETLDDAAGEAFDKIARPLILGYPGGSIIERFAESGNPEAFDLPRPMIHSKDYNFSFSGLKTASVLLIEKLKQKYKKDFSKVVPDFCSSFQQSITDVLLAKTVKAVKEYKVKQLFMGGGVISNNQIRKSFRKEMRRLSVNVFISDKKFCTDNAAMIGICAYYKSKRNEYVKNIKNVDRMPNLKINENILF